MIEETELMKQPGVAMRLSKITVGTACLAFFATSAMVAVAQDQKANSVVIDWDKTVVVSKSTPTLQVVVNPMLLRGAPIHDGSFAALKELGADYVRYVPWEPYPKLAVAELDAPTKDKTSWDFSKIDPVTLDFLDATAGHSTVMNFSTIPAWMFKTDKRVEYPADPLQVFWNYTQGSELKDLSGTEVGDYFGRLVSWYTKGGFTDENGQIHNSGYHYKFPIWEVLNEVDFEHKTTPEDYTKRYDAVVEAIHKVSPDTKFMGLALADPAADPRMFEYFLNPSNHKPGIPLDYISYHFYATPMPSEDISHWQYSFFDQADRFIAITRYIESIKKRLSPATKTDTDELGVILPTDIDEITASKANPDRIPKLYWNAAGSMYAYLYIALAKQGVDVIGESQLVGYPSQFPSVSMMNWTSGKPNARYWVLKLIKDNFGPGDKLVETSINPGGDVQVQGFVTHAGKKLLLLNKRNRPIEVNLPTGAAVHSMAIVDEESGDGAARKANISGSTVTLAPFAVVVATLD
jgi:hypothetical protein